MSSNPNLPMYPYPGGLLDETTNLPWCQTGYLKRHLGDAGPSVDEALANPPDAMTAGIAASLKQLFPVTAHDVPTVEPVVYGQ